MADLLKCPFCGGEAEVVKAHSNTTEYPYVVVCKNDLCNASVGRFSTSREKAIEAWNTRKPIEAVVDRLEGFLEEGFICSDCPYEHLEKCGSCCEAGAFKKAIEIVRGKE